MFGRLRCMFRFTFTTGIDDIPIGAVDWVDFDCDQHQRACSIGRISESEWLTGPKQQTRFNQYLPLDEIFLVDIVLHMIH